MQRAQMTSKEVEVGSQQVQSSLRRSIIELHVSNRR
jgi:hypothetical protein